MPRKAENGEFKEAIEALGIKLCEEAMTRSVRDEFKTYEAIAKLYEVINSK